VACVDGIIYVLLPVHNRRTVTEQFARQLLEQSDQSFRLVLIDDGSSDGTAQSVSQLVPSTVVLSGPGDWWWAGSLQRGYEWLRAWATRDGDLVLIANDDTTFGPDFLATGRASLAARPRSLLLAQLYDVRTGDFLEAGVRIDWRTMEFRSVSDPREVNCMSTRGLLMRVEDFLSTGGFHPRLLPHYLSDYEFTVTACRGGLALASDPAFKLALDQETTGDRDVATGTRREVLRRTLSRSTVSNPVDMSAFLLLACPRRYLLRNLASVWVGFLRNVLRGPVEGMS
jgi:GT2 family glycosyltransferase